MSLEWLSCHASFLCSVCASCEGFRVGLHINTCFCLTLSLSLQQIFLYVLGEQWPLHICTFWSHWTWKLKPTYCNPEDGASCSSSTSTNYEAIRPGAINTTLYNVSLPKSKIWMWVRVYLSHCIGLGPKKMRFLL